MSHPSSIHRDTTQDCGSSINSSLLTPPLTPHSTHDVPFQPDDGDRISLNMKRNRFNPRRSRKQKFAIPQDHAPGYIDILHEERGRSKSLIQAPKFSGDVSPRSNAVASAFTADRVHQMRRWTLPSKSAATRCVTPLRSTVKQTVVGNAVDSPAMITLRRATTSKAPKRLELTFFPEPRFSNERSSFLSYILSTFSCTSPLPDSFAPLLHKPTSTRSVSVDSQVSRPVVTYPAATVYTETTVEPSLTCSGLTTTCKSRRISTRYITAGNSYEIIWDENDNSTTTESSSRQSTADRRDSLAMTRLEAQLHRASVSTKSSQESQRSKRDQSNVTPSQGILTHEKLQGLMPRLLHKTALRDLPRSKADARRHKTKNIITVEECSNQVLHGSDSRKQSICTIDFFPPLRQDNRRTSCTESHSTSPNLEPIPDLPCRKSLGGMVGASCHARRHRNDACHSAWRHSSVTKSMISWSNEGMTGEASSQKEDDTTPLLPRAREYTLCTGTGT